ncbi:ATP-grasp domain-containing protein [Alphaproteobacteria bacterium]|nr:ATP-grasp domain-containing protein [Alphaproteobacteria bacterium]
MLTCVGGELMPQTIKYLRNVKGTKLTIIGTDINKDAIGKYFCDKFYVVPRGNSKNYIEKCKQIVKKEKINLLIPTSDEEALALSRNKDYFEKIKATVACIDFKTLKTLNNKSKTYTRLNEFGIRTAEWEFIKNKNFLKKKLKLYIKKHGGAVIKPCSDRGSRNIFIISNNKKEKIYNKSILFFKNINEFLPILKTKNLYKNYIIMQELHNPVVDIDLLSWNGKAITIIPRKRIHPLDPNMGHKTINNKKLIKLGRDIIKNFNLSWLYDCDVMFDNKKNPIVIEINPRQSGSIAISQAAGFKVFENLINLYLRKKINYDIKFHEKKIITYKSLAKL